MRGKRSELFSIVKGSLKGSLKVSQRESGGAVTGHHSCRHSPAAWVVAWLSEGCVLHLPRSFVLYNTANRVSCLEGKSCHCMHLAYANHLYYCYCYYYY